MKQLCPYPGVLLKVEGSQKFVDRQVDHFPILRGFLTSNRVWGPDKHIRLVEVAVRNLLLSAILRGAVQVVDGYRV